MNNLAGRVWGSGRVGLCSIVVDGEGDVYDNTWMEDSDDGAHSMHVDHIYISGFSVHKFLFPISWTVIIFWTENYFFISWREHN